MQQNTYIPLYINLYNYSNIKCTVKENSNTSSSQLQVKVGLPPSQVMVALSPSHVRVVLSPLLTFSMLLLLLFELSLMLILSLQLSLLHVPVVVVLPKR